MERTTEFSIEIETTESYMDLSFSLAPKKNHDALAQLGKQYVQWLKKHGVRGEIYYLDTRGSATTSNEIPPEGVERGLYRFFVLEKKRSFGWLCNSTETKLMQIKFVRR